MKLFTLIIGLLIWKIYANSNFNQDYPNITFCVIPDTHPDIKSSYANYLYLKDQLGLVRRCTHIRGSLYIKNLNRLENGTDPDLSFLESIVEISGTLEIRENLIKRIPLGNLQIIRGFHQDDSRYALAISHNYGNDSHHLEDVDLHSLRAIMDKNIRINDNHGLDYLTHKVDWTQIVLNKDLQKILVRSRRKNTTAECHPACQSWISSKNDSQHCFGPNKIDCQQRTKCTSVKGYTWCHFTQDQEVPCDRQCAGGCLGNLPQDCVACKGVYKNDQCVSTCAPEQSNIFGSYDPKVKEDKLIYTAGGLCTSRCPDSLLDQDKVCVYECDFTKYYKSGNRCLECANNKCALNTKIGDETICDLKTLDPRYPKNQRKYVINAATLRKLTNCTIILGQLSIQDDSFKLNDVTLPMLYQHLSNVREVIGEVQITLMNTKVLNLTFLHNLREVRGIAHNTGTQPGLKLFVSTLEFLGLKKLEKVYGIVNFNHESKLCYDNTIPWAEITLDGASKRNCDKKCHPLCTRGCWGPGNDLCYKCAFVEAGEYCVEKCEDAPGYYTWVDQWITNKTECRKCHPMCNGNCTGPLSRDCNQCKMVKENGNCVESCSEKYYPVSSPGGGHTSCMPCSNSCYGGELLKSRNFSSACSGPLSILGQGGCSMCDKVITRGNTTSCHSGDCPSGFFKDNIKEPFNLVSVEQISCITCHPLCEQCTAGDTQRRSCSKCKKFWYKDHCEPICPEKVINISRKIAPGDDCPRCHSECREGCHTENNSSTCIHCVNKKIFHDLYLRKFSCVSHCPMERNYSDFIDGDFVCLTYQETLLYRQKQKISFVVLGSLAFLLLAVIAVILFFRYKFKQSKIKANLKAFYSNFNEPNTKNLAEDHLIRPPNMNRLQTIPMSDLIFNMDSKPLGAGAFGKVFQGLWKVPGPDGNMYHLNVVVKVMHNSSKSSTNDFLEEAQIMASVSHRHCLPLIGVCLSFEKPCLVSTFAEFGSLEKYLVQNSATISSYSLVKWCEQIADGMAYLNMRGIIHRDLAARNILVTHKNIVQITDFGLARLVDDTDDGIVVRSGRVPIRWLALETLLYSNYSTASDIWAYGVTIWEIFTFGKRPYEHLDTSKVKMFLQEGNRLHQPDICTLEVYMVMIKCWLEDPHMRPSFTELMTTFEQFSHHPKRFLCLPRENLNQCLREVNKESIGLQHMPPKSKCIQQSPFSNVSDCNDWMQASQNDSAYHLINPLYNSDDCEDKEFLPSRKRTKRNISFEKLKNFPRFSFTKDLPNKTRDLKVVQHVAHHDNENFLKYPSQSYESTSALLPVHKSSDYDVQPINPQIAKLLKQENVQTIRDPKPLLKYDTILCTQKTLDHNDIKRKDLNISLKSSDVILCNRSPKLPPINIQKELPKESSIKDPLSEIEMNVRTISPDSGHSQDFETDDYMTPSRVQSFGYYNLTPSPSTNTKTTMDLHEPTVVIQNDNYNPLLDPEYMEPMSKLIC